MSAPDVVVVGAGAFGGWSALSLLRAGARVTLVDAWGAGNSRASSGGETRVLRHTYGPKRRYVDLTRRALALWREHEEHTGARLFHPTGVLWMAHGRDDYASAALPHLMDADVPHEVLDADELARRWPAIDPTGVDWALFEPGGGYLMAREACESVRERFVAEGGEWRRAWARPGLAEGRVESVELADGERLAAGVFVFACGPWLGRLFPGVVPVVATRQEVLYFGLPAGAPELAELPVWADHAAPFWYGIPEAGRRGFKICDDTRGPEIDPTDGDRTVTGGAIASARAYLARRFPALADAPLVEGRVCQYEESPDGDFIVDRHPAASNLWLVGGGSGHGFKHGPALGEHVAARVLGRAAVDEGFGLARFGAK